VASSSNNLALNNLYPVPGARKNKKRVGRGEGSGMGKTSTRGGKGQTARSGGRVKRHFEGGQTPLYRRIPKVGFTSPQRVLGLNRYETLSLSQLDNFENGTEVTPLLLLENGYFPKARNRAGFKILNNGKLTKKLSVSVHAISAGAKEAIEKLGGSVTIIAPLENNG